MGRGRQVKRWLSVAIISELLVASLVGMLASSWPLGELPVEEESLISAMKLPVAVTGDALPSLASATESAKKAIHRPLFDRPPAPEVVKTEIPRPQKKPKPPIKLIGTIADPSGNRGIFETSPQNTEVRRAGERFEQLPTVQVKWVDESKAVLQVDSEELELAIVPPAVDGRAP